MDAEALTAEVLITMRERGYTYAEIAERFGMSVKIIYNRAREWLPLRLRSRRQWGQGKAERALALFAEVGGYDVLSVKDAAMRAGCSEGTVYRARAMWRAGCRAEGMTDPGPKCGHCGFYGEAKNPVRGEGEDALCLWCWLGQAGYDLPAMAERYGWEVLAGAYLAGELEQAR
jgi:hypothetical protein